MSKKSCLKKKAASDSGIKNKIKQNQQLTEELHKPILNDLKRDKFMHHIETQYGLLIKQICS